MSTGIEWTDETWNPVVGCERVSPGCAHCYAKQIHDQRHRAHLAGKMTAPQYAEPFEHVQLKPERLRHPLSWRRPRRVFVNSVADLFHDAVPFDYVDQVFAVMSAAWHHTFQILTKRPARMRQYFTERDSHLAMTRQFIAFRDYTAPVGPWPLPNVWLGVSVENQRWADERVPLLLRTPAAVRFLSCEPLLGPVDLTRLSIPSTAWKPGDLRPVADVVSVDALGGSAVDSMGFERAIRTRVDWVITGGESGPKARPVDPAWVRSLRDQCVSAGVPFFFKQWGGRTPKSGGRELDGRTWDEMPSARAAELEGASR